MEEDYRHKTKEYETDRPVETVPDDVVEIDPAEFFDPEEFGVKRRLWNEVEWKRRRNATPNA